jgi:nitrogen-specific signal transduction histidine kinase
VIRDITERRHAAEALKQRDDELRQAQKMEAVGRLAGGVAHDFNNLLTAILGYADLLLEKLPADDPNRRQITEIQKAGRSAASLTRSLLAFSRKQVLQPVVLNLNAVVVNSENLLRRLIGENIELITSLEPSIAAVKADPAQIEQLLVNLAVNARDAMPAGGRLTIATVNLDQATTRQHVPTAAGASAALVVRDTGVGMTDEVRAHIFEPFFTTKGPGQGTGLGLASVYGAVKQSGGHVWVESAPGAGSTFTVCLPVVAAMPERTSGPVAENALLFRGTETVLLVEDNDAVRAMARETLTGFGYTVVEATNGKEALRIAGPNLDKISIVVTDVVMPLMGGAELAVRLRTLRPDLKFIFASGYASDPVPGPPASSPGAAFLQKPFTPSALGRTVREVLDAGMVVTKH